MALRSSNKKNKGRYSIVAPSNQIDEIDGEVYPDILTIPYEAFPFTQKPVKHTISWVEEKKPYRITKDYYARYDVDDILMDLNLIPHKEYIDVGYTLYIPIARDFVAFLENAKSLTKRTF